MPRYRNKDGSCRYPRAYNIGNHNFRIKWKSIFIYRHHTTLHLKRIPTRLALIQTILKTKPSRKTTQPKPTKNTCSLALLLLTFFSWILKFFASFSQQPLLLDLIFVSEFFFLFHPIYCRYYIDLLTQGPF